VLLALSMSDSGLCSFLSLGRTEIQENRRAKYSMNMCSAVLNYMFCGQESTKQKLSCHPVIGFVWIKERL
jgi:hypothetical protein